MDGTTEKYGEPGTREYARSLVGRHINGFVDNGRTCLIVFDDGSGVSVQSDFLRVSSGDVWRMIVEERDRLNASINEAVEQRADIGWHPLAGPATGEEG